MLKVKKLDPRAILPTVAHEGDLGYDLYALEGTILKFGEVTKVRTGVSVQEELNRGLLIRDRSSMASKGIVVSGGVLDSGYTGEISVLLTCNKREWKGPGEYVWTFDHVISAGDKIAQMVPLPVLTGEVVEVEELGESSRGEKGFGSSGK